MNLLIANTDYDWFKFLSSQKHLDEVNFWFPKKKTSVRLSIGEPFIFKLKKIYGHKIVGYGSFVELKHLPMKEMWEHYGLKNGGNTKEELMVKLKGYKNGMLDPNHNYGCAIIASPVFFPSELWIDAPNDWKDNWTTYTYYKSEDEEGKRIWEQCLANTRELKVNL